MGRLIFGPPSVNKSQRGNKSNAKAVHLLADNSADSKNNSNNKKSNGNTISNSNQNKRTRNRNSSNPGIYRPAAPMIGLCGHLVILSLPILAMAFTIAFLIVLLVFDRSQIQNNNDNADGDYGVAGYYRSISNDTISYIMSQYEPYWQLIVLVSISCLLVSVVTIARNIQIEIYHKRTQSIIFMKVINYVASIVNVLSYGGLIVAVAFKTTQEDPSWSLKAHYIGASTFFGGSAIYALLQSILLWNQSQYPIAVKVPFLVLAVVVVTCSLVFASSIWTNGLGEDAENPVYEWAAGFTAAVGIGFHAVLFHIDPVDDELAEFFCGLRRRRQR